MTNYRQVTRTTKGGTIKQHATLDWVFYAAVSVQKVWYSTTTRTLEEAEAWIAKTRDDNYAQRLPKKQCKTRKSPLTVDDYIKSKMQNI